jgi:hypothetical protein
MSTSVAAAVPLPGPSAPAVLGDAQLALLNALDALFLGWARELQAEEYGFPPVIPAGVLARVDYYHAFPHLCTFPVSLERRPENLRAFADNGACDGDGVLWLTDLEPVREVLTPAACYHVYALLEGRRLEAPALVTTRATCFRRESAYAPLTRQRAFQMREIVCLGTRAEVESWLAGLCSRLVELSARLELDTGLAPASDPFFAPERSAAYVMQKAFALKTELLQGELALSSLNRHEQRFGRAFGILRDGAPAFSGCVAFGLERWLHAVSARHGLVPAGWPACLREVLCG